MRKISDLSRDTGEAGPGPSPGGFSRLKPRPGAPRTEVRRHQRRRLIAATVDAVADRGYADMTVTGVARLAGVSTHTFYENFRDKEDCFVATYDAVVRHAARTILAAGTRAEGRPDRARAVFRAFTREVAEQPKAARLALIDVFACDSGLQLTHHTVGLFETMIEDKLGAGGSRPIPPLVRKAMVGGTMRVARARLLAGGVANFEADADGLARWSSSLPSEHLPSILADAMRKAGAATQRRSSSQEREDPDDGRRGDDRAMILAATAKLAATDGYASLTPRRIRVAAGVPRRRFVSHFESAHDCYVAALDERAGVVIGAAREALLTAASWQRGIYRSLETVCRAIGEDATLARMALIEGLAPSALSPGWRGDLMLRHSTFFRETAPPDLRPTALEADASVGAIWMLIRQLAGRDEAGRLPRLAGVFAYLFLAPAIGPAAARVAIEEEIGRELSVR